LPAPRVWNAGPRVADSRDAGSIYWVEPKLRGILPLDQFHLSRSLRKPTFPK